MSCLSAIPVPLTGSGWAAAQVLCRILWTLKYLVVKAPSTQVSFDVNIDRTKKGHVCRVTHGASVVFGRAKPCDRRLKIPHLECGASRVSHLAAAVPPTTWSQPTTVTGSSGGVTDSGLLACQHTVHVTTLPECLRHAQLHHVKGPPSAPRVCLFLPLLEKDVLASLSFSVLQHSSNLTSSWIISNHRWL
jgi:hypothetical protein